MNIAIELDGVICTPVSNRVAINDVQDCELLEGSVESLQELKKLGHRITIYTTRDASLGPNTEVWLQSHKVPYDRIIFNKPQVDLMIDDKCFKFTNWEDLFDAYKYHLRNT